MTNHAERAKEVRDILVRLGHSIPLYDLVEQLRILGYSDAEIKAGIALYMAW